MAITACKECGHQVSDRAQSCPSCGAPVAASVPAPALAPPTAMPPAAAPRGRPILLGAWLALAALAVGWMIASIWAPGSLRNALYQGPSVSRTLQQASVAPKPTHQPASAGQPPSPSRPVYQTTAEQLYQDYNNNEVATQSKIGMNRVRVRGSVTEINQDTSGRAVVKLKTASAGSASMLLSEDQLAAAAQLVKGQTVDIQCDKMQRVNALPQGSDCALLVIDAGTTTTPPGVYLAIFLSNDTGAARVYVVGPMSESECLAQSEGMVARVSTALRGDHVAFKNCTSSTPASIPSGSCRPVSPVATLPDMPAVHLWRYDCAAPAPAHTTTRKTAVAPHRGNGQGITAFMAPVPEASTAAAAEPVEEPAAVPVADAPVPDASTPSVAPAPVAVARAAAAAGEVPAREIATGAPGTAAPAVAAAPPPMPTVIAPALAGGPPPRPSTASPAATTVAQGGQTISTDVAASPGSAAPDDLATVRATDPKAADHIASYCAASGSSSRAAECRRQEAEAWTRLVLQNEFPTLDDATRRKCSEPPFPDTYAAKERCARYQLHLD